jgi:uncharacterized membrane protein
MIVVGNSANGTQVSILARGNFSLKASGLISLLLALGAVTLGMAGLLALMGYWPILLVAAVQLVMVSWIFIRVWKNAWIFEEILIDADQISIVRQRYRKRTRVCLASAWATIRLEQPAVSWYSRKLILRCRGQQVELGAFLTEDEKLSLAKHLSDALSEHTAWRKY